MNGFLFKSSKLKLAFEVICWLVDNLEFRLDPSLVNRARMIAETLVNT